MTGICLGEDIYEYFGYPIVIRDVNSLYRRLGLKFSTPGMSSVLLIFPNVRSFALGTIMCVAIKNERPASQSVDIYRPVISEAVDQ